MSRSGSWLARAAGAAALALSVAAPRALAQHDLATGGYRPAVAAASDDGERAIRKFRVPKGFEVGLIAAEPDLANPVAFGFDERGDVLVAETFRLGAGVLDIRGRTGWPSEGFRRDLNPEQRARLGDDLLDADLACRTVEDRERMLRHFMQEKASTLERESERVKFIVRGPDGRPRRSTVFADGFNTLPDGIGAGVLARRGEVWFTDIPNLWRLRDTDGDGAADVREVLSTGYGVRTGFLGHDLHGLRFGPDGRLYFSVGDRGANVVTREGRRLETPDTGAVFRCWPDGSELEIFATGLRNPQELAFDEFGNLWTGDNNSDGGDQARWVYVVEGGDSGWHIGWQFLEWPVARGPWNAEGMWKPDRAPGIAYLNPPLANIGSGPSGLAYNPGTGLPPEYDRHFFMVDFRGGPSGIWTFPVKPRGAGYEVVAPEQFLWDALPTDVEFGPDGGVYWCDWVQGWNKTGKGRIYRAFDPEALAQPVVKEVQALLAGDWSSRPVGELVKLLGHPDQRVRQEAQFSLADRAAFPELRGVAADRDAGRLARLHAVWGLGQLARASAGPRPALRDLLADADPEVRGQAARVLGDLRDPEAAAALEKLLGDPEPRPRFFAAIALGRLDRPDAAPALLAMLRANNNDDPFLRHAGVMGLAGSLTPADLARLASDPSSAVRLAAVVALRRQRAPELARFLDDADPAVVTEAARAINDQTVAGALPALAGLAGRSGLTEPALRRVLNANLRVGGAAQAAALARFAADGTASENARVEALRHLAQWAAPSGRDQVTGLWRPLPARDPAATEDAIAALAPLLPGLLDGPAAIQTETARVAGALRIAAGADAVAALAGKPDAAGKARVAALRALRDLGDPRFAGAVTAAATDANEEVRREALKLQVALKPADALGPVRSALSGGSIREQQGAFESLGSLSAPEADTLLVEWLARLKEGQVAPELQLDLLDAAERRTNGPVAGALAGYRGTLPTDDPLAPRRVALAGGDPEAGRKIFYENEALACTRCHKISGFGGDVGPDLSDAGTRHPREYLLEAILLPNRQVAAGFETLLVTLKDDTLYAGVVKSEDDTTLVVNTPDDGPVTIRKADIKSRERGLSGMPEGLENQLSNRELRDLIEFLAVQKAKS